MFEHNYTTNLCYFFFAPASKVRQGGCRTSKVRSGRTRLINCNYHSSWNPPLSFFLRCLASPHCASSLCASSEHFCKEMKLAFVWLSSTVRFQVCPQFACSETPFLQPSLSELALARPNLLPDFDLKSFTLNTKICSDIFLSFQISLYGRWLNDPVCRPKPSHQNHFVSLTDLWWRPPPHQSWSINSQIQKYQFTAGIDTPQNIWAEISDNNAANGGLRF